MYKRQYLGRSGYSQSEFILYCLFALDREPAGVSEKAQFFREYVIDTLNKSDTPWYTRIQAILHQNQGPNTLMYTESPLDPKLQGLEEVSIPDGYYTRLSFCLDYGRGLCKRLMAFSPTKEINWVKSRKGKPV